MSSLGEEYPKEQARCRELLDAYKKIGNPGMLAAALMENLLKRADRVAIEGDIVEMMQVYEEMQECQ